LYLAVLLRADDTPRLAWALPVIQVLWVNTHGLFVLGPVILAAYVVDRLPATADARGRLGARRWWGHVGGATAMVVAACLANPYGLRGALFPLELFPKITAWGGPYKSYIGEFMGLRAFVRSQVPVTAGNLYVR